MTNPDEFGTTGFDGGDEADEPMALVANTVKVYEVPLLNPGTVTDNAAPDTVAVCPPGAAMAVYDVIGEPPDDGAVHDTTADPLAGDADTLPGTPGTAPGTTALVGADGGLEPMVLVATTVKVYGVPLVSPVTVTAVAVCDVTVAVPAGGDDVAVYDRIGDPPSEAGSTHWTVACPLDGAADAPVGEPGTNAVPGVIGVEGFDGTLDPWALRAVTVNV